MSLFAVASVVCLFALGGLLGRALDYWDCDFGVFLLAFLFVVSLTCAVVGFFFHI